MRWLAMIVVVVLGACLGACTELGEKSPFPHADSPPRPDAGPAADGGGDGAAVDAEEPDA
jgi:hypothetical protein